MGCGGMSTARRGAARQPGDHHECSSVVSVPGCFCIPFYSCGCYAFLMMCVGSRTMQNRGEGAGELHVASPVSGIVLAKYQLSQESLYAAPPHRIISLMIV